MSEHKDAPEILWADHDFDRGDGGSSIHTRKENASGNEGIKGYEPIQYIRSDIVEQMVYDQHMTYEAHKEAR